MVFRCIVSLQLILDIYCGVAYANKDKNLFMVLIYIYKYVHVLVLFESYLPLYLADVSSMPSWKINNVQ